MNQSEHINELATALAKCQGEITPAIKDSNNPFFKSKYADLNSVWSVCREPLSRQGLAVIQTIDRGTEGEPILITTLAHSSGQWIRSVSPIPIKEEIGKIDPNKKAYKNDPQALGSSISYMRRYCLSSIVGIVTDDDDGEGAMNRNNQKEKSKEEKKEKPKANPIMPNELGILMSIYADCSEEYMNKVFKHMKDQYGFESFEQITQDVYPQILNGMKKNAELQKAKNV